MAETTEGLPQVDAQIEQVWRAVLTGGHSHRLSFLPGAPKCATCRIPMKGLSGYIVETFTGLRQSRKNPNICNLCDDNLPMGGAEVDIAVLFADVRGSTTIAEKMGPTAFAQLLNRFYRVVNNVLISRWGLIDKMVGDEVMALFLPNTGHYRENAVSAAVELLRGLGYGSAAGGWIPVGVGVHAGTAFVGRIGSSEVHDFTALGDTINSGARLQALAQPGEIVMSEEIYRGVGDKYPGLESRRVELRGKSEALDVRVLHL